MNSSAATPPSDLPTVYVTEGDLQRLSTVIGSDGGPPGAALLREELGRAILVHPDEAPENFARLGSIVRYQDGDSAVRTVQLVMPEAADIDRGRVSVFSPVGAALFGLPPQKAFLWRTEDGRSRTVRVLDVTHAASPLTVGGEGRI